MTHSSFRSLIQRYEGGGGTIADDLVLCIQAGQGFYRHMASRGVVSP